MFVNSRGWYKNLAAMLKAFEIDKKLSNEFDLLCFGDGGFSAHEMAAIERAGLTGKVHFKTGSDAALASADRNARPFVFPSLYE